MTTAAVDSERAPDVRDDPGHVGRGRWRLRRGATVLANGVSFAVWAPAAKEMTVVVAGGAAAGEYALTPSEAEAGVWEIVVPKTRAGDRYGLRVNGSEPRPDPASRSQPDGVHGMSEVVDPRDFAWRDSE